jgi:hypothetical protein
LEIKLTATDTSGATASDVILMKLSKYGAVIDGYISGATLFLDANKNGVLDVGEPSTTIAVRSRGEVWGRVLCLCPRRPMPTEAARAPHVTEKGYTDSNGEYNLDIPF